jgi:hypothetical protein
MNDAAEKAGMEPKSKIQEVGESKPSVAVPEPET